jgi:hypothetical protein
MGSAGVVVDVALIVINLAGLGWIFGWGIPKCLIFNLETQVSSF